MLIQIHNHTSNDILLERLRYIHALSSDSMTPTVDEQIEILLENMDKNNVPLSSEIDNKQYCHDFNVAFKNLSDAIEASDIEYKGEVIIRCNHIGFRVMEAIGASEQERMGGNIESRPDFTSQIENLKGLRDSLVYNE